MAARVTTDDRHLVRIGQMAKTLQCSTVTVWRYVRRKIIKQGVYRAKGTRLMLFDEGVVLQQLEADGRGRGKL